MAQGRKPNPKAIKKLKGGRRVNKEEPEIPDIATTTPAEPVIDIPPPPEILNKIGQDTWIFLCTTLHGYGVLKKTDQGVLIAYCKEWEKYVEAETALKKESSIITALNGIKMLNPWLKMSRDAQTLILRYACEMGLTPSSRTKVRAEAPAGKKDDIGDLLD